MSTVELTTLIAESRALRAELRTHLEARKAFAREYLASIGQSRVRGIEAGELRVLRMTSLLVDAHQIARRDEEGLTLDLITDALEHLNGRLEREVLPRYE